MHPDDQGLVNAILGEAIETGGRFEIEHRLVDEVETALIDTSRFPLVTDLNAVGGVGNARAEDANQQRIDALAFEARLRLANGQSHDVVSTHQSLMRLVG